MEAIGKIGKKWTQGIKKRADEIYLTARILEANLTGRLAENRMILLHN